jgi:hypothetical protein
MRFKGSNPALAGPNPWIFSEKAKSTPDNEIGQLLIRATRVHLCLPESSRRVLRNSGDTG